jgi:uncharacterized membrane protein YbaN (DUF454 family)
MARPFYLVLGWLCVVLGVIGIFLPLLPTTVFMIAAAFLFGRGSPRARAWLIEHRIFGPAIVKWEKDGAIPRIAKIWACVAMAGSFGLALWFQVPPWVLAVQGCCLLAAAIFVVTRPE